MARTKQTARKGGGDPPRAPLSSMKALQLARRQRMARIIRTFMIVKCSITLARLVQKRQYHLMRLEYARYWDEFHRPSSSSDSDTDSDSDAPVAKRIRVSGPDVHDLFGSDTDGYHSDNHADD